MGKFSFSMLFPVLVVLPSICCVAYSLYLDEQFLPQVIPGEHGNNEMLEYNTRDIPKVRSFNELFPVEDGNLDLPNTKVFDSQAESRDSEKNNLASAVLVLPGDNDPAAETPQVPGENDPLVETPGIPGINGVIVGNDLTVNTHEVPLENDFTVETPKLPVTNGHKGASTLGVNYHALGEPGEHATDQLNPETDKDSQISNPSDEIEHVYEEDPYENINWQHIYGTGRLAYTATDPDKYFSNEIYETRDSSCRIIEDTVYVDECVPFTEKTCHTQQKEQCSEIQENNCTAEIDTIKEEVCFNVTDLVCQLIGRVEYKIQDKSTRFECTNSSRTVCNSVSLLEMGNKDTYQCVDLEKQYCWVEEQVKDEKICIYSVEHDCDVYKHEDKEPVCEKTPTTRCYSTPRKVRQEKCEPVSSRVCQKLTERIPNPTQIQSCREVPVQLCSLVPSSYPERDDSLEKEESGDSLVKPEKVKRAPADIEMEGNPSGYLEKVSTSSVYQEKVDSTPSYTEKDGSSPSYLEKGARSPVDPEKVGSFSTSPETVGSSPALSESLNSSLGIPEKVGSSPFIPENSSVNPYKVASPPTDSEMISPESSPERIAAYIYSEDCKPVLKKVCENIGKVVLRPVCRGLRRSSCIYYPQETCKEEEKKYCYKTGRTLTRTVCKPKTRDRVYQSITYL